MCSLYSVANHRNVVQFFGFSGKGIVTELMEGGDLRAALKAHSPEYTWERRGKAVALDVARGLLFLHNCGVIHRWALPPRKRVRGCDDMS